MKRKIIGILVATLLIATAALPVVGIMNVKQISMDEQDQQLPVLSSNLLDDVWGKTFGGSDDDYGHYLQRTADGGYIITGSTNSFSTDSQIWLIKTDGDGNQQWAQTFGGSGVPYYGESVIQTSDGGYAVAGWLNVAGYENIGILIKTDAGGNMDWFQYHLESGAHYHERIFAVEQTTDGGFIMTGHVFSYEDSGGYWYRDLWMIKTDTAGVVDWTQIYGGYTDFEDIGRDVIQSADGGYVVVGITMQLGSSGAWMIKTDAGGSIEWDYKSSTMDQARSVIETSDGSFIWAGSNWLCKMTDLGNIMWKQVYDSSVCDNIKEVIGLPDGGFSCVGGTTFITTDSSGALVHNGSFEDCNLHGIVEANLGYGVVVGSTTGYGAVGNDVVLIKGPLDWMSPEAEILSPLNGLYLGNLKILPLNKMTIVIGSPTIEIMAADVYSGMDRVEIFVDGTLEHTVSATPYEWKWVEGIPGIYTIKATAHDVIGNQISDEIMVLNIF